MDYCLNGSRRPLDGARGVSVDTTSGDVWFSPTGASGLISKYRSTFRAARPGARGRAAGRVQNALGRYIPPIVPRQHRVSLWRTSTSIAWSILIVFAAALACDSRNVSEALRPESALVRCIDPRPRACARENLPVCGVRVDGSEWTYAGSCSACGHETVVGHRPGGC